MATPVPTVYPIPSHPTEGVPWMWKCETPVSVSLLKPLISLIGKLERKLMVGGQRTVLKRGTMIHGPSPPTQLNPKNYIDRTYRPAVELSLMCCKLPFMCFLWTFRCFHRGLRFYEINSSFLDAVFATNFSTIVLL